MLTLDQAHAILHAAIAEAGKRGLKPLAVLVLDGRGALKAALVQDGSSLSRDKVAFGKAYGALSLGIGSRALHKRAEEQPYFVSAVNGLLGGALIPVPGGVLVKVKKPKQDRRIDLPTMGVTTVEKAAAAGLRGIAVEAGGSLLVDRAAVAAAADRLGLFVTGIEIPQ